MTLTFSRDYPIVSVSLGLPYTAHASRFTIHAPRLTIHDSRFTIHDSRFTIHDSRFTIHDSRFTIHDSRFTISPFTIHHFTIHHSPFTIHHSPSPPVNLSFRQKLAGHLVESRCGPHVEGGYRPCHKELRQREKISKVYWPDDLLFHHRTGVSNQNWQCEIVENKKDHRGNDEAPLCLEE